MRLRWKLSIATAASGLLALATLGHPLRWTESALLMHDIAAGGAPTAWQDVTTAPTSYAALWSVEDRKVEADVYVPAGRARAALVLAPGAAQLGRDEPRLQALARALARAGFVVAVPELEAVRRLALSRADADGLADALRALGRAQPGLTLGIAAISYGVGPAVIATLAPDLNGQVAFVVGIGGYHNSDEVIRFVTTGAFRRIGDGRLHRAVPNRYGRWAFMLANAELLPEARDAALLKAAARRKLGDPAARTDDLWAAMGADARAVLELMENADPERVPALLAALPAPIRAGIDGLNLALHDLRSLKARLILIHGRDDRMIPYSESEALAAAAPKGASSLYLVDSIGHVEFDAVSLANAWTMWRAVDRVLAERD
jgi:pimeloyl-ACP methyl ester carboxylesterase